MTELRTHTWSPASPGAPKESTVFGLVSLWVVVNYEHSGSLPLLWAKDGGLEEKVEKGEREEEDIGVRERCRI